MEEPKKSGGVVMWSVVVLILAVASYGGYKYLKKDSTVPLETVTPIPTPTPIAVITSYLYKNGSYSSIGKYMSPSDEESIGIEITLKDDVIVDAKATPKATIDASIKFQGIFSENFKSMVIGKKIDEVELDKVSGSSLTPKGFNDAIEKIKSQAKV